MPDSSKKVVAGAQGGRVWVQPKKRTTTPPGFAAVPGFPAVTSPSIHSVMTIPALVIGGLGIFGLGLVAILSIGEDDSPSPEKVAYEQEYGYSTARYGDDHFEADVVTTSGEEKTVGYLEYDSYQVFYENEAQLIEKIGKIEAGTYPEALKEK